MTALALRLTVDDLEHKLLVPERCLRNDGKKLARVSVLIEGMLGRRFLIIF